MPPNPPSDPMMPEELRRKLAARNFDVRDPKFSPDSNIPVHLRDQVDQQRSSILEKLQQNVRFFFFLFLFRSCSNVFVISQGAAGALGDKASSNVPSDSYGNYQGLRFSCFFAFLIDSPFPLAFPPFILAQQMLLQLCVLPMVKLRQQVPVLLVLLIPSPLIPNTGNSTWRT
jgi:hypothetical protein